MFEKLVQYKKQHKNTMVPNCYGEDPKLGIWISTQRKAYKKDELNPNRVDLLNSINLNWEQKIENHNKIWMGMFQKLVEYQKQHKKLWYHFDIMRILNLECGLVHNVAFTKRMSLNRIESIF